MNQPTLIRTERHGDIALMQIDNPPVNALSPPVFTAFGHAIEDFERDATARALVIACAGRTFVAGGDIASFDDPAFTAAPFNRMLARMERLDRPVVAAIHGFALGGGLELALACHWRVATPDAQLGLPEVKLGLLPGSLGTQRLPRLLGIALAYDLIATGRSLDAHAALACGLIDAIAEEDIVAAGLAFAPRQLERGVPPRRVGDLPVDTSGLEPGFFEEARNSARAHSTAPLAALAIVDAVEASTLPFAQGEQVEARAFETLRNSPESKVLRQLFFERRRAPSR
jgi:3-hydroxyacyl-CoA dehydrogenase